MRRRNKYRRFSPEFKAEAVRLVLETDFSLTHLRGSPSRSARWHLHCLLVAYSHRDDTVVGDQVMTTRTQLRAGRMFTNHNEALKVRSTLKAGRIMNNHNAALKVRSALTAPRIVNNHNEVLQIRSTVKAGRVVLNHNEALKVRTSVRGGIIRRPWGTTTRRGKTGSALKAG